VGSALDLQSGDFEMATILNGNDAIEFLSRFEFWTITRSSNGKIQLTIKDDGGEYTRVYSRKNETLVQLVERARQNLIIAGAIEC
jgi:hypothetical protein